MISSGRKSLLLVPVLLAGVPALGPGRLSVVNGRLFIMRTRVERGPGAELGDYTELPINDAARLQADSYDADRISVVRGVPVPSALARLRISEPG
jgi:hypothetical protein